MVIRCLALTARASGVFFSRRIRLRASQSSVAGNTETSSSSNPNTRLALTMFSRHSPLTDLFQFFFEEALDEFPAGEFEFVFGDEEAVVHAGEGVFDEGVVFVGAE